MLTSQQTNDYWEAIREHIQHDNLGGGPTVDTYGTLGRRRNGEYGVEIDRHELTSTYSWTVTDPATVEFVLEHCGRQVVDPLAGSGWWAHLLGQVGVDAAASDLNPPSGTKANSWRRGSVHLDVARMNAVDAITQSDPARTLLLSWPSGTRWRITDRCSFTACTTT